MFSWLFPPKQRYYKNEYVHKLQAELTECKEKLKEAEKDREVLRYTSVVLAKKIEWLCDLKI